MYFKYYQVEQILELLFTFYQIEFFLIVVPLTQLHIQHQEVKRVLIQALNRFLCVHPRFIGNISESFSPACSLIPRQISPSDSTHRSKQILNITLRNCFIQIGHPDSTTLIVHSLSTWSISVLSYSWSIVISGGRISSNVRNYSVHETGSATSFASVA